MKNIFRSERVKIEEIFKDIAKRQLSACRVIIYVRTYCSEQLVLRGGALRPEKDEDGAVDRRDHTVGALPHQPDQPNHH